MTTICFVNPNSVFNSIGGAEVQIHILATEAAKKGYKVFYITRHSEMPDHKPDNITYLPFKESGNFENDYNQFQQLIDKVNPDIVYQRGRKLWSAYTIKSKNNRDFKLVFATSMDIDCYNHKFLYRKPRTLREGYKRVKHFKENLFIDHHSLNTMQNADILFAQTKTQKKLLKKNLGIESIYFPNIHYRVSQGVQKTNPVPEVLWLANVKRWKRPELYLKAVKRLSTLNCKFTMVGDLTDSRYKSLIEDTKNKNPSFRFLGKVTFDQSNDLIRQADLFVNTSDDEEGFPNTFLQCWLRKIPTISYQFDPDNLIKTHQLGLVSNGFDAMCNDIESLVSDQTLRTNIGKRALKFANEHFSVENNIDSFFNTIETMFK